MQRGKIIQQPTTTASDASSVAGIARKKSIYKTFQTGDRIPPHHAPVDVIVLVLKGQIDITLGEETGRFQPGEYAYFPAGQIHSLTCIEEARVVICK